MRALLLAPILATGFSVPARSQSFNVDFEPTGSPFGQPPATYGAAAQSPGYWNGVGNDVTGGLVALDGSPTGVALATTAQPANAFFTWDYANTSGADEALLDDFHRSDDYQISWIFSGLAAGDYDVYTILVQHGNGLWVEVSVPGSSDGTQHVGGVWNGAYAPGLNYAKHHVSVAGGTISIDLQVIGLPDYAYISGLQLVKDGEVLVGIPQCFGDGSGAACPCGNSGTTAHGCQNSAGTGGALLTASGTTSPDTVVLHSSGELPSSLSIFLQGNATIAPTVYGDGLRCTGGILKRLYKGSASGGAISRPGMGDPSITARSAALGDPIPMGERRYYQVYFRDANPNYCAAPLGNTFNISNALKVTW